ncbi:TBXAS1, partial [Cordylochernes scorpioides]
MEGGTAADVRTVSFPSLAPLLFRLAIWSTQLNGEKSSLKFLLDVGDHIYRQRLKMPEVQRKDVLQLLIDYNRDAAKTNGETLEISARKDHSLILFVDGSKPMLSDDEIVMNAITFIFGGWVCQPVNRPTEAAVHRYDTTAVTLKFALHTLAHHQDVQDKVREEVRKVQGDKDIFDPDDVGKLTYMEQVLSEVLRLYPPSPMAVQRLASKDYEVNGKKIPKSIPFIVALDALHRSEKYWDNPEEFDPERFSPEQKANIPAFVYQPFGAGPRMCIGMRMANMVDKALLALILSKFRLVATSETDK